MVLLYVPEVTRGDQKSSLRILSEKLFVPFIKDLGDDLTLHDLYLCASLRERTMCA